MVGYVAAVFRALPRYTHKINHKITHTQTRQNVTYITGHLPVVMVWLTLLLIITTIVTTALSANHTVPLETWTAFKLSSFVHAHDWSEETRGARFAAFYAAWATTTEWRPQSKINVLLAIHADKERSNVHDLLADPAANLVVRGSQRT